MDAIANLICSALLTIGKKLKTRPVIHTKTNIKNLLPFQKSLWGIHIKNRNTLLFATNSLQDIKKKRKIYETYINEKRQNCTQLLHINPIKIYAHKLKKNLWDESKTQFSIRGTQTHLDYYQDW